MEHERFDCIIVGGGIAGLSAAMTLARADLKFLLVERGTFAGAKNVSGGVLWGHDLARLVPNYWDDADAHPGQGFERFVRHRRLTFLDETSSFSLDFKSSHFDDAPYSGLIVLRARFDRWLADRVQDVIDAGSHAADSFLATDILVDDLVREDGRVAGIRTGEETFYADSVILAEGVNNLLTRKIGLQRDYVPAEGMATGVKEVIRFDRKTLEDRFQLDGLGGLTNEFVGFASGGVEGGGFLYTNRESVSIGVVLGLADLRDKKRTPYDILNDFKAHPAVADMLRGGEVVEYSAHMVSTGDLRVLPKELYADGVLVAGEAAHLVLNSGKAIQGMDFAMRSGILAAETVVEARARNDFGVGSLKAYREKLDASYVMQDLHAFQGAVELLHRPDMFQTLPNIACDFGRRFFTVDTTPTPKARTMAANAVKNHTTFWNLFKLARKAAKHL